jgi:predicted membrane-bound spermidine synthase
MDQVTRTAIPAGDTAAVNRKAFTAVIYVVAFVTGAIVMSFEMLGSRYLNPYFGSGIYTWASLISTVLAALCVGYFLGGWLADRNPSARVLGVSVVLGSAYVLVLPLFAKPLLEVFLDRIDDIKTGSLVASFVIMFVPVTLLGMYSPFAIRLMLDTTASSGTVSGTVYGVSTAGSIVGTLGTTFFLIPLIGSFAITLSLGIAGIVSGLVLVALPALTRVRAAAMIAVTLAVAGLAASGEAARAEPLVDEKIRAEILTRKDGRVAHIETSYNDIFVQKEGHILSMAFQLKGWDYTQSEINLRDPDDLPVPVARQMTMAVVYPKDPQRILMVGLGGGTISAYLGRYMPDAKIDTVEIDAGVITAAKKYFGLVESPRVRYLEGDGRVFLNRNRDPYDLILMDAFHGGYIPFHLLTKEFFALIKQRLKPGGAVAINLHDGTKLFVSAIITLRAQFPTVHLYPTGEGEVIAVATLEPRDDLDAIARRAAEMQEKHKFRFPLAQLIAKRIDKVDTAQGVLLTDDFAPADLYNALRESRRKKK